MALKDTIDAIFLTNTNYNQPSQAVNQAASLKYLSSDLYRDSKRFIYELLQNADDSYVAPNRVKVCIRLLGNKLLVAHTGKAFDSRDVRGLTAVDDGTKKNASDKTGFKGIGFKSVFGQSDHVVVFSEGEYFRFDANYQYLWNSSWPDSKKIWEEQNDRRFEMPWQLIPISTPADEIDSEISTILESGEWTVATIISLKNIQGTIEAVEKLAKNINMFLFLKSIKSIEINTGNDTIIGIQQLPDDQTTLSINHLQQAKWLKRKVAMEVPPEIKQKLNEEKDVPEKLKQTNIVELTLAAKITEQGLEALGPDEKLLYAYLPTEETVYDIPVLVNAAFYTVANRESLHQNSAWNDWLFQCIPAVLLKWIAELVSAKRYDGYNLLPEKLRQDDSLAQAYNREVTKAFEDIPVVMSTKYQLLKVREAIVDYTSLSETRFIGDQRIRDFITKDRGLLELHQNPFALNIGFKTKLKKAGVVPFEWGHVSALLENNSVMEGYPVEDNKNLIEYLREVSENERITQVCIDVLKNWRFVLNHKDELKSPSHVFFPSPDDVYDSKSDISFIHPQLQEWLGTTPSTKQWLEDLGIVEKSDLTYFQKNIIPNVSTYIKKENALDTLRKIFNLYLKGDISPDVLESIGDLKILTTQDNLIPANQSYLSANFHPRLPLETLLEQDIYVGNAYVSQNSDLAKWRMFLLILGVNEGISVVLKEKRLRTSTLFGMGFNREYFVHAYTPFQSTFKADEYQNIVTLSLLAHTIGNLKFAKSFWNDVIERLTVGELIRPATTFWGRVGMQGDITGTEIANYPKWAVANIPCLPVTNNLCLSSTAIFLNEKETLEVAGKYLPVFDGPPLNPDWRAFFNFKPRLELEDYLLLLTKISDDPAGDNKTRIQSIYDYLLDNYSSWETAKRGLITEWVQNGKLASTAGSYKPVSELKYYIDGDNTIFGDSFTFIQLGKNAQKHPDVENLLSLLQIDILRQSIFQINASASQENPTLKSQLKGIIPFWAKWMEKEKQSGYLEMLYELELIFDQLQVIETTELSITYGEVWQRKVSVHHNDNTLYVLSPWYSPKVMFSLPEKLCEIFHTKKYTNELAFLLTSSIEGIKEHFLEEGRELPPLNINNDQSSSQTDLSTTSGIDSTSPASIDYQYYWNENQKRNKVLLDKYPDDPERLLINGLLEENPFEELNIYHFSHIENAVSIIKSASIKSRRDAVFKDSAGSGIISQTDSDRKAFARFYFRPRTPTQYYVENLGRANESLEKINSDPLCPVPVFFIIPLQDAMKVSDWSVSIGSLASSLVEFGKDAETISKFDFGGVYQNIQTLGKERFLIAAHQEFLAKDELDLSNLQYHLAVQDESARLSLLAMLGSQSPEWETRIVINPNLYNKQNAKVDVSIAANSVSASLTKEHNGYFLLQHSVGHEWQEVDGQIIRQHNTRKWITTFSGPKIALKGNLATIKFKLFYLYKGHVWLIHTNTQEYIFEIEYAKGDIKDWFELPAANIDDLFSALKAHPELAYWLNCPVGGPDELTLEEHTLAVVKNYQNYFAASQRIFSQEKDFLLCLALHDIGKPAAIALGDKNLQHRVTLEIIDRLRDLFPVTENILQKIKLLVDADPIGKYLNPTIEQTIEMSCKEISDLKGKLGIPFVDFFKTLIVYYQCDAAGYNFLRKRLFLHDAQDQLIILEDKSRLVFNEVYENKFKLLLEAVTKLYS